jgi:pilus assembly protein CpaC
VKHRGNARKVLAVLCLVVLALGAVPGTARAEDSDREPLKVMVSTHTRLSFDKDVQRVAVADPEILGDEILTPQEVLLLGEKPGRTTVFVWFEDGSTDFYLVQV